MSDTKNQNDPQLTEAKLLFELQLSRLISNPLLPFAFREMLMKIKQGEYERKASSK